jgi:hypothetical protein
MGYGAIIGAIGSIAGSVIGSATKGSGASGAASQYSSALRDAANRYIRPFTGSDFWKLDPTAMAGQSMEFGIQNAPVINQANMTQLQSLLNQAMPGYQGVFQGLQGMLPGMQATQANMQANANQLMTGQVPTDVQQQIQRSAAFTSMMGGQAGAGTGATGAITARDLGLTSLQLMGQGATQAGQAISAGAGIMGAGTNLLSFARNYLMPQPVDPTSLLPLSDLLNASEWSKSAQFQANQAMYTGLANAAAARAGTAVGANSGASAVSAGLGGLSGLLSAGSGSSSGSLGELLSGLFSGGGGGGGGGIIDTSGLSQGTSFGY